MNYGDWLRFDAKGAILAGLPAAGISAALGIPQINPRRPLVVVSLLRLNNSNGVLKLNPRSNNGGQSFPVRQAAWYSLFGGVRPQDKGKAKLEDCLLVMKQQ